MRLSRRAALGLLAVAATAPVAAHFVSAEPRRAVSGRRSIAVAGKPIACLRPDEPGRRRFGALTFRAGLELSSPEKEFGGWSGLWRSPDGTQLVAISDRAHWLTAQVECRDGVLAGLGETIIAPVLGGDARPLRRMRGYDTESLAIGGGSAYIGSERAHEVRRFAWDREGTAGRGVQVPVPPEVKRLPSNAGLEALGVAPPGHPLAGSLLAIAEQARGGEDAPTRGWVLTGPRRFWFEVARSQDFDITDMAFLPSGEVLLLERRFRVLDGVACRIRRIAAGAFRPGALVDGDIIFEADRSCEIDNLEGIAVHGDPTSGETVVSLISDDNFFFMQRTLLLEFSLG